MKILAETPEEQALLDRIKIIGDNMAAQDNRSTMMPMWTILDENEAGKDYGAVMFFTDAAAQDHVKEYGYHYEHPGIYVRSAHVNDELKDIVHLLLTATGNEINSNHYRRLQ